MIIGIDGNEANSDQRVGVSQYSFENIKQLYKLQDDKTHFVIYLKNSVKSDLPKETNNWKYEVIRGNKVWVLTKLLPRLFNQRKLDVFWSPSHYLPVLAPQAKVCTIHDLGYLKFSEQFKKYDYWQLKYWSAISIIVSKYIICPSESVKKDIVRRYNFAALKTRVVCHGYDKTRFNTKINKNFVRQICKKYRVTKKYILFISTLKPSKNIEGLLKAFRRIRDRYDYQLVIAGKKGWLYEDIFTLVNQLNLRNDVVFTDYLPEEDKPSLMTGAELFVLPSFWEGFGMDILSSLACGTPVVVSKIASIPEVAGKAGIYIDPYKIESITKGIDSVLSLNKLRYNNLVKIGLKHVENFSWKKSARETLQVLKLAANN